MMFKQKQNWPCLLKITHIPVTRLQECSFKCMSCASISTLLQIRVADELKPWEKNQIQIKYLMALANAVEVVT